MRSEEGPFGCFGLGEVVPEDAGDDDGFASSVFFISMVAGGPFDDFDIRLAGGPFDAAAGFFAPVSALETIDAIREAGGPRLAGAFVIASADGLVTAAMGMDGPDIRRCPPLHCIDEGRNKYYMGGGYISDMIGREYPTKTRTTRTSKNTSIYVRIHTHIYIHTHIQDKSILAVVPTGVVS
jgi:hypothetical protein